MISQPIDAVRLGARVAASDIMEFVNNQLTVTGALDGELTRDFLLDYWINAGGLDEQPLEEVGDIDDGEG